ncbi:unnamed protein product [Amoebophrya sp. A25]|nr:unnamed protein product [Amoebophrya sp. A25]|eukprot:GSA25T00005246001.1
MLKLMFLLLPLFSQHVAYCISTLDFVFDPSQQKRGVLCCRC